MTAERQGNYAELRHAPRKMVPSEMDYYLSIFSEDEHLLFKARIVDISELGVGLELTQEMHKLLGSLRIVKNFVFNKARLELEKISIQTGVIWVWNNEGRSGIRFHGMMEMDQKALGRLIANFPACS